MTKTEIKLGDRYVSGLSLYEVIGFTETGDAIGKKVGDATDEVETKEPKRRKRKSDEEVSE